MRILEKYWNENKQQPYAKFKRCQKYKKALRDFESQIEDSYYNLLNELGRDPNNQELKKEFNKVRNGEREEITFHKFVKKYLKERQLDLNENALGIYQTTYNHIKDYEKNRDVTINFKNIDIPFNRDFSAFLYGKGHSSNTVGKYISKIKTIMKSATERGVNKNLTYKKFKVYQKPSESAIFLDEKELNILYNLDLSHDKVLDEARDMFLVGCWTGQRFQTYSRFSKENIIRRNGQELISVFADKTEEKVIIPLHWQVKEIMEKYNGGFPPSCANQTLNRRLKIIGELAGFTESVEKVMVRGKKIDKEFLPKYKMIGTHTARRSFATNTTTRKENPIPEVKAMKITGHKKMKTFLDYVRASKLRNALELGEHDFFNKNE